MSQESSKLVIILYFLIIRLSTTQNMMDYGRRRRGGRGEGTGVRSADDPTSGDRSCTHVHDEGHDEHDHSQLQLGVSDVA